MKAISSKWNRVTAMLLVMALLLSGTNFGLKLNASAGDNVSTELYTLLAETYFSNDTVATSILKSGALSGNSNISIRYPGLSDGLVSVSDGVLTAANYASNYSGLYWKPYRAVVNDKERFFGSANTVEAAVTGQYQAEVEYRLTMTNISPMLLMMPAMLMSDAIDQKSMLDRLSDDTYMDYMKQLDQTMMSLMAMAVKSSSEIVLHTDSTKNAALKNCFSTTIYDMSQNCYDSSGKLTIYNLLLSYRTDGLAYYYQNSSAFITEIDLFSGYLTELLRADSSVGLTKEDKMTGLRNLFTYAAMYAGKPGFAVYADRISELETKMAEVKATLTAPSSYINVNSPNLKTLTDILETGETVTLYYEQPVLRQVLLLSACAHTYDDDNDTICNNCGYDRSTPTAGDGTGSGSGSESGGGSGSGNGSESGGSVSVPVSGNTTTVNTLTALKTALSDADEGDTISISGTVTMTENLTVPCAINLIGAENLKGTGFVLVLGSTSAAISADSEVKVASGVDGYVPVKASDSASYALAEAAAPSLGSKIGTKSSAYDQTRYLFVDLDPSNGMSLTAFGSNVAYSQLSSCTLSCAVSGSSGADLIKTGDQMVVTATNSEGARIATITYTVIVMGDTNCNGKVNTSDVTVMKSIGLGMECSLAVRMAADVNCSGSLADPKVNSSDATYIMNKYFTWSAGSYATNLQ